MGQLNLKATAMAKVADITLDRTFAPAFSANYN